MFYDNQPLAEQLAAERENLEALEAFAEHYPEAPGYAFTFSRRVEIDLCHCDEQARTRVLAKVGETLGRTGWMKRLEPGVGFTYRREIDGVKVEIRGAEQLMSPLGEIPVPPSAFPILLEETAPAAPAANG